MTKEKLKILTSRELAKELGIDYEVFRIKKKLALEIKKCCEKNKISQRALARQVPGLTQDRISKIFNEQIGGMTIDKLIQILSALKIKLNISLKKAG